MLVTLTLHGSIRQLCANSSSESARVTHLSRPCHRFATRRPAGWSTNRVEKLMSNVDGKSPQGKRVLVVEDEPHIRELVALHLGLEGLQVTQAGAGDEALKIAETQELDLIVLDLMLPKVDGVTVCRA